MVVCSEMDVYLRMVFQTSLSCSNSVCPTKVARQAWLLSEVEACRSLSGKNIAAFCKDDRLRGKRMAGTPASQRLGQATSLQALVATGTADSCSNTMCP